MALVCTHCSRVNSPDACFCWYDGASLLGNGGPIQLAQKTFLAPFVFPAGVSCKNFDELSVGCQWNWDAAVGLLQNGFFVQFFQRMGRRDLAQIAQEAAAFPDRDRGLDLFLARLPSTSLSPAKLDVQPKLINLGTLQVGQDSQLELTLENRGSRLVFGTIASTCPWLTVSETGEDRLFQFRSELTIVVQVKGQHLRAGVNPLEGNLVIESNAGTFRLKAIASVPIQPFPDGALAGAKTPREIAEKAKARPQESATLFESGAVARWYASNGWIYPVQGPAAGVTGIAAAQQFFEALGLARPPKVFVSEKQLDVKGMPGTKVTRTIQVRSEENRPVYAVATCAADWLVVKPSLTHGNVVTIPLEITLPANPGELACAYLRIASNGNQRFDIAVNAIADAPAVKVAAIAPPLAPPASKTDPDLKPVTPPKKSADVDAAKSQPAAQALPAVPSTRLWTHLAPLALLGVVLLGLVTMDVFSDAPKQAQVVIKDESPEEPRGNVVRAAEFQFKIEDEPDEQLAALPAARFKIEDEPEERFAKQPPPPVTVDIKDEPVENAGPGPAVAIGTQPLVRYSMYSPPKRFGISGAAGAGAASNKQLTYSTDGRSNSAVVSVNGGKTEFGSAQGKWTRMHQPIVGIAATPGAVQGSHSTWTWGPVAFHQVLEVVPGQPVVVNGASRRQLDTVLVRWIMQNHDAGPRTAGLRMQLDTLIGANDGVPFTVPGNPGLVTSFADFRQARDVPDFIQALERPNLKSPGTIAHLTLKPGGGIEPAQRVSLTRWPGFEVHSWDILVGHMGSDSAVVMYWPEKALKPGEARTVGFAYGLGMVTANDKLGITLGGQFEPGQNFTVSAYVENPIAGQTVRLELPDGLKRVEGNDVQTVAGGRNTAIVTWKVLVERTGEFKLKVHSSTGLSQAKSITIARGAAPTGGKLALDLQGSFEPGQTFTVRGKVSEPIDNQTLTLHLPAGLQQVGGEGTQRVPTAAGTKDSVVEWQVRVEKPGKYPVRVSSSTGIAQTKTITIVQPTRAEGAFQILLAGDFAPGKTFTVSTKVASPALDQKLTLVLPAGLERTSGEETQVAEPNAQLTWNVKVQQLGKFTVGVKSTTGVTQRKTVVIEPPAEIGGRFQFDFKGDIRPGKEFTITAEVAKPAPGQTLTLTLPKGLQLANGDARQDVPRPTEGDTSFVVWQVRVVEGGRLPVRIESSTGVARTKTITLTETNAPLLFGGN